MPAAEIARVQKEIDALYRRDSRRIFATLIRLLGDFDRAEEALSDAFRAAMEKWPTEGLPQNPVAWLVSAGRFKSIDKQRRDIYLRCEPLSCSRRLASSRPGRIPIDLESVPQHGPIGGVEIVCPNPRWVPGDDGEAAICGGVGKASRE